MHTLEQEFEGDNAKSSPASGRREYSANGRTIKEGIGQPSQCPQRVLRFRRLWWYDTNGPMLATAYASSGIAMGAAAAAILVSSRSIVLTLFSTLTVGYVLTSVTARLVAMGWTLGFLDAILFAILIGISCDFVIHFTAHLRPGPRRCQARGPHSLCPSFRGPFHHGIRQ